MKTETVLRVIKGVILAYVISGVILLVLALLMFRWNVSEGVVRGGIIFAYVLSCFISGMMVSRAQTGRRYLWGILMGVLYYSILLVVSLICTKGTAAGLTGLLSTLFLCVFGGMLGGMLQAGRR